MQFIEELTMIHKAAIGVSVALIMVLLVVSARRRRAAAAVPAGSQQPVAAKAGRRDRKKESVLPGRKRRKLAAEAAHSMGVDSAPVAAPQVPEVPNISLPEAAAASAPVVEAPVGQVFAEVPMTEPVAEVVQPEPVALPVIDDPYLHEGDGPPGAFVAQPGWPAPGELASSFDPDAFDPLPEARGPLNDDAPHDEFAVSPAHNDDTTALEMPEFSTAGEVAALEEIEEWTDTFDAGDSWNEPDDEVATDGTWTISPEEPQTGIADPPAMDIENIWSEPDEEPLWDVADDAPPVADAPPAAIVDEGLSFNTPDPAWADDSQDSWQADVFEAPATALEVPTAVQEIPTYEPAAPAAWNGSIGGPSSPVVLDLAGLAASGQSLELVIEPSADGHGVRLRFGAPGANSLEVPAVVAQTAQTEFIVHRDEAIETNVVVSLDDAFEVVDIDAAAEPVEPVIDMSFLAGVAPSGESQAPAELSEVAVASAPVEIEHMAFESLHADVEDADSIAFDSAATDEDVAMETAPSVATTTAAVMDADDDPARILADIRARLAALDARR